MKKAREDKAELSKNKNNILSNLFADMPEFSFRGNREVVVEGSRGVVEYNEDVIRVNTSIGLVCFEGRGLNLRCISPLELIIDGFITKVEFVI